MNSLDVLQDLPPAVVVLVVLLMLCQIGAMIWALVRLWKDKRDRVIGLPRVVCAVIIVLGELLGAIAFLVLHIREQRALAAQRRYQASPEPIKEEQQQDTATIIKGLYKE